MQLPGMLIEYLITGSCALIWMVVLAKVLGGGVPSVSDARLVLFIPAIYVVGMIIDYVAHGLVDLILESAEAIMRKARSSRTSTPNSQSEAEEIEKKGESKLGRGSVARAYVFLQSPDLTKQYEMRSSRDRVARGAFLNSILLTISLTIFCPCSSPYLSLKITLPAGLLLCGLCFAMWHRFERLTSRFQRSAYEAILKKEAVP
jgi:hypothetical protein